MDMRGPKRARGVVRSGAIALLLAICLPPTASDAHTALQGMGSFWSGVAHLLTSLDQLAFLLGLAIWASFQDIRLDAIIIRTSALAVLAGTWLAAEFAAGPGPNLLAAGAVLMMLVGLAGAVALRVGILPLLGVALIGGVACGAAHADTASGMTASLFSLGGSIAAASVLSYGLLVARRLENGWGSVARRAGASWIAATGLIVLALLVSRNAGQD
jgi:hydrogenase/urease accessory protein HupE